MNGVIVDADNVALRLYNEGRVAAERRELGKAAALLEASVWVKPHFKSLEILGTVLAELGQEDRAIVYLAAAAGLAPKQIPARVSLAKIFASRNETYDARVQLEEALRANPQSSSAAKLLASIPRDDDD